jgi:ribonuclease HI
VPPIHKCKLSILSIVANSAKIGSQIPGEEAKKSKRPAPRQVKLNVDASFHPDVAAGAVGAVLRDYKGTFIAASTKYIPHVSSVEAAEALAMREGLALAIEVGCNNIQADSDSMDVIEACSGEEAWWNESAATYADCMDMVATIGSVSFSHCPREANVVADELARFSFLNKLSCNWVDDPPSFILNSIVNDATFL